VVADADDGFRDAQDGVTGTQRFDLDHQLVPDGGVHGQRSADHAILESQWPSDDHAWGLRRDGQARDADSPTSVEQGATCSRLSATHSLIGATHQVVPCPVCFRWAAA